MSFNNPFNNTSVDELGHYEQKKHPRSGPGMLTYSYKEQIKKTIAYYEGRYAPNTNEAGDREKLIQKEYLDYLRGLL